MEGINEKELKESIEYLDEFEKGLESEAIEKAEGGEEDPLKLHHQKKMMDCIKKAKFHKEIIDKIEKGDALPDEAFEEEEEKEDSKPAPDEKPEEGEVKKGEGSEGDKDPAEGIEKGNDPEPVEEINKGKDIEEIVKGAVTEALNLQKDAYDKKFEELKKSFDERLEKINAEPVRKSLIKGAQGLVLQKAISGEKEDGKTVLSASLQKGKVSDALYSAFESEKDSFLKGQLGEAVAEFESAGYISPGIAQVMYEKGYKIIK